MKYRPAWLKRDEEEGGRGWRGGEEEKGEGGGEENEEEGGRGGRRGRGAGEIEGGGVEGE